MSIAILRSCCLQTFLCSNAFTKCFNFKKIHGKDSDIYTGIQVSDKLSDHKTELGKKLQKSDGETDDFMKLLTKILGSTMDYTGLSELIRMIIIFMIFHSKFC